MARVDFSWISGLADPLIEAAKQQQAANLVADFYASQNKPVASAAMPAGNLGAPVASPSPFSDTPKLPAFAGGGAKMVAPTDPAIERKFTDTLRAGGLTNPNALAAFTAYANAESRFSPKNITGSWSDPSESGQPGTSGGILSWRGSRLANMQAATKGAPDPVVAQAKFALTENPDLTVALQGAKTPEEAHQLLADAWKFAGYNRPGGENERRLGLTRAYLSRLNGTPMQTASAADLPASGAQPIQGFVPPAGTSAPAGGGEAVSPQLMALLRNPLTAAFAQREIERLSKGREFKVVGDKAYWIDPRRQTATEVPGVGKPVQWSYHQQPDGGQIAFNPQTREVQVLKQGGTWRPATQEERQAFGTPANTGLAIGPSNQPKVLQGTVPSNKPEDAYNVGIAQADVKRAVELNDQGRAAGAQLDSLKGMERLMKDPNFYSGFGGELSKQTNRALSALGIKDAGAAKAQEAFSAISNTLVLDAAGGSLGAQISNTDRDFIREAGPSLAHTPEGNQEIINIKRKTLERQQEVARLARTYAKNNNDRLDTGFDDFMERWREEHPLFSKEEMDRIAAVAQAPAPPPAIRYDADRKRISAPPPPAPAGPAVIRYDATGKRIP